MPDAIPSLEADPCGRATALKANRGVTQLGLAKNEVGLEGAKALAEALGANATLAPCSLARRVRRNSGGSGHNAGFERSGRSRW